MVQQNGHDSRAWDSAVSAMVGECIDRDPENALSQIDQFGLPPDQIDRVRAEMLKRFSSECPELALTWMQQHPDDSSSQTDSQQLSIYSNWARGYPDEANAWAVKNGRPDFLASDVQKGVMNTLQSGWQPGDASNYWFSRLKGQFDAWQQLQPNETDVWLNGIPSTLRNDLTGKSNATH